MYNIHLTINITLPWYHDTQQSCNGDFGEALFKQFIMDLEPVSIVHYTMPGTCINHPLHRAWIQYQAAHSKLVSYPTPFKLAIRLPQN